jgi:hypothetical protein
MNLTGVQSTLDRVQKHMKLELAEHPVDKPIDPARVVLQDHFDALVELFNDRDVAAALNEILTRKSGQSLELASV